MHAGEVKSIQVSTLCDSGAFMLAGPEHIVTQLDLPEIESREKMEINPRSPYYAGMTMK